jgi:hypothetical protein
MQPKVEKIANYGRLSLMLNNDSLMIAMRIRLRLIDKKKPDSIVRGEHSRIGLRRSGSASMLAHRLEGKIRPGIDSYRIYPKRG